MFELADELLKDVLNEKTMLVEEELLKEVLKENIDCVEDELLKEVLNANTSSYDMDDEFAKLVLNWKGDVKVEAFEKDVLN